MSPRRPTPLLVPLAVSAALVGVLSGCAPVAEQASTPSSTADLDTGHGAISGAAEMPEPQPHLVTIDDDGTVAALDLLDESTRSVGSVDGATSVTTDGRFVFAANAETGDLTIVDSGVWTWDHEDHFHYYRAEPRIVGTVAGEGEAVVSPGGTTTGVFFPSSGEALLLDTQSLKDGEVIETTSIVTEPHTGSITPIGTHALVTIAGRDGAASAVRVVDGAGDALGEPESCTGARGARATPVGVAVVCDDGALLAVESDGGVEIERIPLPAGMEGGIASEGSLENRRGRPVLAVAAEEAGFWALDSRQRTWTFVATDARLLQVTAVDDTEGHVVAVTEDGRVLVASVDTGQTLSVTEPFLSSSLADATTARGITLSVDRGRAYVNAPAAGVVHEIDFADGARIARTFDLPSALFAVETGV